MIVVLQFHDIYSCCQNEIVSYTAHNIFILFFIFSCKHYVSLIDRKINEEAKAWIKLILETR